MNSGAKPYVCHERLFSPLPLAGEGPWVRAKKSASFKEALLGLIDIYHASTIPIGGLVIHLPRVKSGKSTGALLFATDFSVSGEITLHVAAS